MSEVAAPVLSRAWLDLGEVLSHPIEPVCWQIDGLCERGDVVVLAAPPAHGKSFFAMQLSLSLATKRDVWGRFPVLEPGRVAYFNSEMSQARMTRYFARLCLGAGVAHSELVDRVAVWNDSGYFLDDMETADALEAELISFTGFGRGGLDLIVFDTLRRCLAGDEQDSGAMARLFASARGISKRLGGPTILFLHHFRKRGQNDNSDAADRVRGSSDILAAADHVFAIQSKESGRHRLVTVKSREREPEPLVVRFDGWPNSTEDDAGDLAPLRLVAEDTADSALADGHRVEAAVIRFLQGRPGRAAYRKDILAALAADGTAQPRSASKALSALKAQDELRARGGRGLPVTYHLVSGGEGVDALL